MPFLQEPMAILAFCSAVCAVVFLSGTTGWGRRLFSVIPSVVFVYYIPTFATTFGLLPAASPVYDWMRDYLLPFSLFLLMVTADIPTILRIGPKALLLMVVGTLGVVVGGPIAYLVMAEWLPPDSWKALAALSGSWIGGGANFAAIKESVGATDSMIGPIIIVDTAVGYSWTGILLVLANYQRVIDKWNGASTAVLEDINQRLSDFEESEVKPMTTANACTIIAVGFVGAVFCRELGYGFHEWSSDFLATSMPSLAAIFTGFTWMVIFLSTFGILLSFTRLRNIETGGASKLGYAALYLFLTSIGAKADLRGILAAPELLLVGLIWIVIHVAFLFMVARLIKAPLFLVAIGSQANIGGAASAPIVAAAYYESMAPVGLLMGVMGYLLGNYAGLLCALLLKLAAG